MKKFYFHMVLSLIFSIVTLTSAKAQSAELTVIGNAESVSTEMTTAQLKSVMRGEQMRWADGTKVKIALMKTNTPVGKLTSDRIYNMTGNELNKYFLALVFQGKVKAPTFFNSASELEAYVAQTPGAIGVVQNAKNDQLIIVIVDGKKQI
jgi:ABC-type phosphate transport system substrate-binding protein